jgi:hypothetical protein
VAASRGQQKLRHWQEVSDRLPPLSSSCPFFAAKSNGALSIEVSSPPIRHELTLFFAWMQRSTQGAGIGRGIIVGNLLQIPSNMLIMQPSPVRQQRKLQTTAAGRAWGFNRLLKVLREKRLDDKGPRRPVRYFRRSIRSARKMSGAGGRSRYSGCRKGRQASALREKCPQGMIVTSRRTKTKTPCELAEPVWSYRCRNLYVSAVSHSRVKRWPYVAANV